MSEPAKAHEPSMEEILASIRCIIADDDATKPAPAPIKQFPRAAAPVPPAAKPAPLIAPAAKPAAESVPEPAPTPSAAAPAGPPDDFDAMLSGEDEARDSAPAGDVLDLTESMQVNSAAFGAIDGLPDVVFSEPGEPGEPRPLPETPLNGARPPSDRSLMSPRTAAVVDMAFNSLAHTVLVQNSRTLEDLVREMLKPMLKEWLDDNLPNMVERLVRAEIERVSRGRG
jgi:cell pole-organizing protein PopZ